MLNNLKVKLTRNLSLYSNIFKNSASKVNMRLKFIK